MNGQLNVYRVLLNIAHDVVAIQKEDFGRTETRLSDIVDGENATAPKVQWVPGESKLIAFSFLYNEIPVPDGWIVLCVEAWSIVEAQSKAQGCWWKLSGSKDIKFLKQSITQSGKYQMVSQTRLKEYLATHNKKTLTG